MTEFLNHIISLLEPLIGKNLAIASIKTQCKKMGISPEELSSGHAEEFIRHLQPALSCISGKERSQIIMEKIRNLK